MSIRLLLIIFFLLISVVPLSIVVFISFDHSRDVIRETVDFNVQSAAKNTANEIDNWMDARRDDIRVLSQSRIILNADKRDLYDYLNTFQNEYRGVYREFFMLDRNGNIKFSTLDHTGNASKDPYFNEAMNGKLYISDVYLSPVFGDPEIIISSPIRNNRITTGVFAARVSLENLYRDIENIDIGKSAEIFIVNKDGSVIFHENRSIIGSIRNDLAVSEVTYEKNDVRDYTNYRGEKVLGSYYWLPLYRWGIIVEIKQDEAYSGVLSLGEQTVGVSSIAVICVVILAIILSKRITAPIKSLENGALGLVEGNFKPVQVTSSNEIGRLTDIFNNTAKELLNIRRKLEAKIELANKDLEEKNRELIAANEELKKLDELKSEFLSLVSHELKTPLSSMRISAEYLESEADADPAIQKEMLAIILRNIDRQTRLINDILDLSKIEAGKTELRLEHVDIGEIANVSVDNIRQIALKKNITVSADVPEELSPVLADREKLIIVLNNLLDNALKFTPEGGSINISAREMDSSVELSIKDTGIGIEKEKLDKIFDKFYQVDSTSRRKIGGCGLGLSISSGIIKAHDSAIHVKSEPGKGTTFSFSLKKVEK
ncbi:MAG: sensor histidine kinase [Candidatus Methanoperedens sp.]|nr:sensor histidine kinase [Candidatus Methanoperedens sp.]